MSRNTDTYTSLSIKRANSMRLHDLKRGKQTADDVLEMLLNEHELLTPVRPKKNFKKS